MSKLEKILDFFPLNRKGKKQKNTDNLLFEDFQSYHFFKRRLHKPVSMWKWLMLPASFVAIHFACVFLQHQPDLMFYTHSHFISELFSSFIHIEHHYLKTFFITLLFFRGLATLGNPYHHHAEKMAVVDFSALIAIGFPYAFFSLIIA